MSTRAARAWLLPLALLPSLSACTLDLPQVTPCDTSPQCTEAFGWGHTCGDAGYCEVAEAHPRCDHVDPPDLFANRAAYRDRIVLGSIYDRSAFPLEMQSIALAVSQANENNGVDTRLFAFVQCNSAAEAAADGLSTEQANAELADYLAGSLGAPAIVGPATSARTEAAFLAAQPYGSLVISPSATSPALTYLDGLQHNNASPGLLWRTVPPDDLQGAVIAQDMATRGKTDVAVIHETGPYGEGLAEVFVAEFGGRGALFPFSGDEDRDAALAAVNADFTYEEVLFISSERSVIVDFLVRAENVVGLTRDVFLTDGAYDTAILQEVNAQGAGPILQRVRGTRPAVPGGNVYNQFVASFAAAYDADATASGFTSYAYDAAWLVIYGAAWAIYNENRLSGTTLARGLRRVSDGSPLPIRPTSWNEIRANFQEGNPVDIEGASGQLDYDPLSEETSAPIDVWGVDLEGDAFVVLQTIEP